MNPQNCLENVGGIPSVLKSIEVSVPSRLAGDSGSGIGY